MSPEDRAKRDIYDDPGEALAPLPLKEGILRCPQCTWDYPLPGFSGGKHERTYGCSTCRGTGHARTWIALAEPSFGHLRVRIQTGRPGAASTCGEITLDENDWADLKQQLTSPALRRRWTVQESYWEQGCVCGHEFFWHDPHEDYCCHISDDRDQRGFRTPCPCRAFTPTNETEPATIDPPSGTTA